MRNFIFATAFLCAVVWGYYQPAIFPKEKFGHLFIITSMIGGLLLGVLSVTLANKFENYK